MFTAPRNNITGRPTKPTIKIGNDEDEDSVESPFTKPQTNHTNANTLRPGNTSSALFPAPNSAQRVGRQRHKVVLQPGHSPLDWAELNSKTASHVLRGVDPSTPPPQIVRITKDELKKHKIRNDCWTSINGKVFNITPYVDFHPGGVDEIMKCAGRDGTALFYKYHSWVNVDRMLSNCMVGILVA
ncbi:cytochrome b5-like heme/steroid binding domain-containing protein [Scheffersomyces amazonensis]|uniref:cytochrome b5-like heme/steroid binding domain-containing protein n=1 Tax=Scheffersomyces amazonensis TaxID=1078765 RepID=UPI00315DC1EE